MSAQSYVRWFSDIRLSDVPEVGGKNASLGELYAMLEAEGVRVPEGFALSARAYRDMLAAAGIENELRRLLSDFDHHDVALLAERAVAVRSSATAEDLPTASFAGQHESFLNVRGESDLFEACRRCFASIFTDRAIVYRIDNGFDHFKVALSVGVMKMIRSDLAASGVIFTLDTESGFRDVVFVTGAWVSARTSCKARSTRTSSTSTNRPSGRAIARC
jgi:pyruvate, water dikinase